MARAAAASLASKYASRCALHQFAAARRGTWGNQWHVAMNEMTAGDA